jgi:ribonuclease HII
MLYLMLIIRNLSMPNFDIENLHTGKTIVGIDEVGRGSLAGPVVVAAVILNKDLDCTYINDSKKLSVKKRKAYSAKITHEHISSIAEVSAYEIDQIGINNAIFKAAQSALDYLKIKADLALLDGNYKVKFNCPTISIIKGDAISYSIAAASIIAKNYRDSLMRELAKEHNSYKWEKNSGYGTKEHIDAIKNYGPCCLHRKTFLKNIINC